jgi:hypothetical protein
VTREFFSLIKNLSPFGLELLRKIKIRLKRLVMGGAKEEEIGGTYSFHVF